MGAGKNEEMQRIMIAECADAIKQKKSFIKTLLPELNELSELFEDLTYRTFTTDDLKDAIFNNAKSIKRRYVDLERNAAEQIGVSSLRREVTEKAEMFINPFTQKLERIKKGLSSDFTGLIQYLTVTETGEVVFTDDEAKRLEEDTHVYLTDPKQIEKYMMHQAITRLLNDFFDNGDGLPLYWWQMFPIEKGVFIMPENGANYAGMIEQVARKRGELEETQNLNTYADDTDQSAKPEQEVRTQKNRQRGGTVAGIAKKPDYIDRGAEARAKRQG